MAKFFGVIGFEETQETRPGVFEPTITERNYSGDILRSSKHNDSSEQINDNVSIYGMKYIQYMGVKWKITDVEIQHPRMTITIGGIYNGYENTAS